MSVYGSQYNNSLRTNVTSGLKESFGGGKFHINGLLKGVGINMIIDIFRATSNWFLASQIKELNDAMNNEETKKKKKITVIAGND